ncbi:MAG: FAD:protein FMN transferase [Actinomycetota bacterium]|nr:FAD:protein FMN transferase [Actinomycetota bacterium]
MKPKNIFFKTILLLSLSLLIIVYIFAAAGCSNSPKRFEDTREKMGTFVNIIIYGSEDNNEEIIESSFQKIDELNKVASNYDSESSVSVLNRDGIIKNAPAELIEIINIAKDYNIKTEGAFDITVNPILELWSEGLWKESDEIQRQKVNEAMELMDSGQIRIDGNTITLGKKDMSVTLGGIAKGYIVDEVIDLIKSQGIDSALVNAGGDISILGAKPGGLPWSISLENPDNTSEQIVEFSLIDKSIATSGNYYRYFDPEKEAHHIIDPRTGFSSNECISVTIISENATIADILATSVFVLGPKDGLRIIEGIENTEAFIIDNERNFHKSSGIEKFIVE